MTKAPQAGPFKFIAGALCLDFVNSVGGRIRTPSPRRANGGEILREQLLGYEDLLSWSQLGGAVTEREAGALVRRAQQQESDGRAVFARALCLREAIYSIFLAVLVGHAPQKADLAALNGELAIARGRERLQFVNKQWVWRWEGGDTELDRPLWPVAQSAAALLASPGLARVRECPGERCGWLFLDGSKNHSRQWCTMRDCGNLAKVRRFRARRTDAA
ncbi:MAG: CGNR zinc finger domain-containing protein [Acidobacteriia bacterium]|nr:CGNR zinc finger domain-containing protein [Terriglobia bacterium]